MRLREENRARGTEAMLDTSRTVVWIGALASIVVVVRARITE
jgi:hypothetical protein